MEIKATLNKPYTDNQRIEFIVQENHKNGYEIRETENALEAWGYTQEELEEQEKERIAMLSLTKREVLLALFDDKGITPDQIKANLDDRGKIEFDYANEYFRGNPLINTLGLALGYTSEQLDYLFEYKTFPPVEEETNADS